MHKIIFAQATYYFIMNFKNLENVIFKKMRKQSILIIILSVWCFFEVD